MDVTMAIAIIVVMIPFMVLAALALISSLLPDT